MSGKEAVERAVEVVPRDPRIPEIVEQLKEIIERQKMVVVAIEQRLVKKSGSDFSLHLPIQVNGIGNWQLLVSYITEEQWQSLNGLTNYLLYIL